MGVLQAHTAEEGNMKSFTKDLTEGHVVRTLIQFSIPFFLANLLQAFYSVADMLIVGWFTDASGIAAISIGGQLTWFSNSLIGGVAMGGTILIGQYLGAKRDSEVKETIGTMLSLFFVGGVLITIFMVAISSTALGWLKTPAAAFDQAHSYLVICSMGIIFIFGYNAISAILRGMGDSKSPLLFVAIACVINILLDLLFVAVFHWGAAGAAVATVLAQAISMFVAISYLSRHHFVFDFKLKNFRIGREKAKQIIRLGMPLSIQDLAVSLSFIFISSIINSLGLAAAAAAGIAMRLNFFAMLPALAMSMSVSSMTAQNIGAGLYNRAKQVLYIGIGLSAAFSFVMLAAIQIRPDFFMGIFSDETDVIAAGSIYLRGFSPDILMVAFIFSMNGFFNGCGHTGFSLWNSLISTILFRTPLAWFLVNVANWGLFGVGLAAPLASLITVLIGIWYFRSEKWKESKLSKAA